MSCCFNIFFNFNIFVYTPFKLEVKNRGNSNGFVKTIMKGSRRFHMLKAFPHVGGLLHAAGGPGCRRCCEPPQWVQTGALSRSYEEVREKCVLWFIFIDDIFDFM